MCGRRKAAVRIGVIMKKLSVLVMLAVAAAFGQTVNISGAVTGNGGTPLQGVIVRLIASQIADTTDANGAYVLSGSVSVRNSVAGPSSSGSFIRYENNMFVINAASPAMASIKLFDMLGSQVATVYKGHLGQGKTVIPFRLGRLGQRVYLVRVGDGTSIYTCKVVPMAASASFAADPASTVSRGARGAPKAAAFSDWLQATKLGYSSHLNQLNVSSGVVNISMTQSTTTPDFGPNVFIFDPSMNMTTIQNQLTTTANKQIGSGNQFNSNRYAYFFRPGHYTSLDVRMGYYMEAIGLGLTPDSVAITGSVHSQSDLGSNNATCTFWKSVSGISVTPTGGADTWAASQGAPIRRMHIKGALALSDGGWSSGGFIADCKVDGNVDPGSQQQYFSRNNTLSSWGGGGWNYTFVGSPGGPTSSTQVGRTVVAKTPVIAEKPFLAIDNNGNYFVLVPDLHRDSTAGVTWTGGATPGVWLPIDLFYITKSTDNAASINAALAQGKNILFTPGHYNLESTVNVTRPGTVVLGIGFPTLAPTAGNIAMKVSDVDGVRVAGFLFEGTTTNSPVLLQVGDSGSTIDHSKNPTIVYDIFCRAGGQYNGLAACFVKLNGNDAILDHAWLWRADHGAGAGWNSNVNANGLVVNGNNVTAYGLFVEHTQQFQTWWNGNNGRTFFYQSEMPYDPPDQTAWMRGTVDGYPSYKVSDGVTVHEAWGLGVYSVFSNNVTSADAFEVPSGVAGVKMHHMVTEKLGGGQITHVINGLGGTAASSVLEFP
jgi:hypothetical protein